MEEQKKELQKTIKVELEVTVKLEDIDDIICTALEGGIGYWACLDNSTVDFKNAPEEETISETTSRLLREGKVVTLIDEEEDKRHELTLDKLLAGLKKYMENPKSPYEIIDHERGENLIDCCMVDANVADMIIQYAIFGEVIFA